MTYTPKDAGGFFAELDRTYGIKKDWVVFKHTGGPVRSIVHCLKDQCTDSTDYRYVNLPQAADTQAIRIANPKDVVTKALPSIDGVLNMLATALDMQFAAYNGSLRDVPNTFAPPVFMLGQGVASMATVKDLGEKQAKADKVKLVLEILGAVFAFLPSLLDDLAPALEVLDHFGLSFSVVTFSVYPPQYTSVLTVPYLFLRLIHSLPSSPTLILLAHFFPALPSPVYCSLLHLLIHHHIQSISALF